MGDRAEGAHKEGKRKEFLHLHHNHLGIKHHQAQNQKGRIVKKEKYKKRNCINYRH
jgi:hypothetical protein